MAGFFKKIKSEKDGEQPESGVSDDGGKLSRQQIISNIFDIDDITAGDIMTHRTDIEAAEADFSITDVAELSIKSGFSRLPVFRDDLDHIEGIIYVKDFLKFVGRRVPEDEKLKNYIHSPLLVPETVPCANLFAQMTQTRIQLAIVVDEYGGTAGLVTMEDILESIVGSIQDEYDDEDTPVKKLSNGGYLLDGSLEIDEVNKLFSINIPDGDYDTIAGFVINQLGYIPKDGEEGASVQFENVTFTVKSVADKRIEQIEAQIN